MATLQQAAKRDPTRTLMIRKRWEADLNKRFRLLKQRIRQVLSDPNVFGGPRVTTNKAGQFDFARDDRKVDEFMSWLDEQQRSGEIQLINRPSTGAPSALDSRWANVYIDSAYQQGIRRARSEMRQAGLDVPPDVGAGGADDLLL